MFKLKHECISPAFGKYVRLNTEAYGGTILSSWMDRPLSLAGRVILNQNGSYTSKTVNLDCDLLVIPNVAIHMNRSVNSGYAWNMATDMLPLYSMAEGSPSIKALLAEKLECSEEDIVGDELFVYNRMEGSIWGAEQAFFSAPRIDNLMCAYGTLCGFCEAEASEDSLQIYFAADNEAVMDIISKDDLVQNFPDEGVFALSVAVDGKSCEFKQVEMFEGEEDMYFRTDKTREESDEFANVPAVSFMETVENICTLKLKRA
jgi:aspartyl aminopeptidase